MKRRRRMTAKIGFIGAGNMAEALMRGLIEQGVCSKEDIIAGEIFELRREYITKTLGVQTTADNRTVIESSDTVFLAVKPQHIRSVLEDLGALFTDKHLVVSIVAGIPIKDLQELMPRARIVRVMPNQPCMVMASASAFSLGPTATVEDAEAVKTMLEAVGIAYRVDETLLDAVTGLSGSGPAYAYLIIEALSDGGVLMGLPREISTMLAAQTLLGAAKTILDTGAHPGQMKDIVSSPGGTTMAGLQVLEEAGIRGALIDAVQAATERSGELGRGD